MTRVDTVFSVNETMVVYKTVCRSIYDGREGHVSSLLSALSLFPLDGEGEA